MRLARTLTALVYASTAVVAAVVLSAPWWRPADGDLSFGFLMAGLFVIWLQLAIALAMAGLLAGIWAVSIDLARGGPVGTWARSRAQRWRSPASLPTRGISFAHSDGRLEETPASRWGRGL